MGWPSPGARWSPQLGSSIIMVVSAVALATAIGSFTVGSPFLGLAAALAVLSGVIVLLRPDWATLAVIALLYSNAAVVASTVHGLPKLMGSMLPLVLIVPLTHYILVRREPIILTPVVPWLVLFLTVQVIGSLLSVAPAEALEALSTFVLEGFCLYLIITNVVRTERLLRRAVWVLLCVGAFLGALSLLQVSTGTYNNDYFGFAQNSQVKLEQLEQDVFQEKEPPRLGGPIGEKNRYAQIMVVLLPLGILRARYERSPRLRVAAWLASGLIAIGASLTFSRGAAVGVVLTLLAMSLFGYVKPRQLAVVVVGLALLLTAFPRYVERVVSIETALTLLPGSGGSEADGAIRGRLSSSIGAVRTFVEHPVVGVGPDMYRHHHRQQAVEVGLRVEDSRQPHSLYPHIAAETGLLGLVAFTGAMVATMRTLGRTRRRWIHKRPDLAALAAGLLFSLVAYLATGLFLHLAYQRYYWLLLALGGAAGAVGLNEIPEEEDHLYRRPSIQGA